MDSYFNIDTYGRLLTYAVFVVFGFDLSKTVPMPKNISSWIVLVLAIALLTYVGMKMKLISVFGYDIFVNEIILGFSSGLVVGFVLRLWPKIKIR